MLILIKSDWSKMNNYKKKDSKQLVKTSNKIIMNKFTLMKMERSFIWI